MIHRTKNEAFRFAGLTTSLLAGIFCLLVGVARYQFGSIAYALAYVRGERLFVAEPIASLSNVEAGRPYEVTFRLVNLTSSRYLVVGCTTSCGCTAPQALPLAISPSGETDFKLRLVPGANRSGSIGIRLFTDHPDRSELPLRIDTTVASFPPNTTSTGDDFNPQLQTLDVQGRH